jgi:hypothetical protein
MIKNFNEFIEESLVVGKGNYFLYIKARTKDIEKIMDLCPTGHILVKYKYLHEGDHKVSPVAVIITHLIDKEHAEALLEKLSDDMNIDQNFIFSTTNEDMIIKAILTEEYGEQY